MQDTSHTQFIVLMLKSFPVAGYINPLHLLYHPLPQQLRYRVPVNVILVEVVFLCEDQEGSAAFNELEEIFQLLGTRVGGGEEEDPGGADYVVGTGVGETSSTTTRIQILENSLFFS